MTIVRIIRWRAGSLLIWRTLMFTLTGQIENQGRLLRISDLVNTTWLNMRDFHCESLEKENKRGDQSWNCLKSRSWDWAIIWLYRWKKKAHVEKGTPSYDFIGEKRRLMLRKEHHLHPRLAISWTGSLPCNQHPRLKPSAGATSTHSSATWVLSNDMITHSFNKGSERCGTACIWSKKGHCHIVDFGRELNHGFGKSEPKICQEGICQFLVLWITCNRGRPRQQSSSMVTVLI